MFEELLEANADYASSFTHAGIDGRAAKAFCLVTCMDTRIEPLGALGLSVGDAKILRNAGGRVTEDVLRSLVLATNFLGVRAVAVMHHTGCALANSDDSKIADALGERQRAATKGWSWLSMPDPDAALSTDVEAIRGCGGLAEGVSVEGWRLDVDTGAISRLIRS